MGLPFRWNPVSVTILPLRAAVMDEDFGEREGPDEYDDPVILDGQPYFYEKGSMWEQLDHGPSGDQMMTRGHVLFKVEDLTAAGYTPKKGDKVVQFGPFTPAEGFKVKSVRPVSPLRGIYLFLRCEMSSDDKVLGSFRL